MAATKKNGTALALVNNKELAKDTNGLPYIAFGAVPLPEGGENVSTEEFQVSFSRMKLLNPTSDDMKVDPKTRKPLIPGASPGLYYNQGTGEIFETLTLVPLSIFQERYFTETKGSKNIICFSRDGRGVLGLCLSGEYSKYDITTKLVSDPVSGAEIEAGFCKACKHSKRAWGATSNCQHVQHLICAPYDFIKEWAKVFKRVQKDDPEVTAEIMNKLFTYPFRSTSLAALRVIHGQAARDGSYSACAWNFGSELKSNELGEWFTPTIGIAGRLTPDEIIFARSLRVFAATIRPVMEISVQQGSKELSVGTESTVDMD